MAKQPSMTMIPVQCASVTFQKDTARMGVKMSRGGAVDLVSVDALLTGARLDITFTPTADDGETPTLPGIPVQPFSSVADCKHLGVGTDVISAGLTFQREGLDVEALARLANVSGKLKMNRIGDADEKDDEADE